MPQSVTDSVLPIYAIDFRAARVEPLGMAGGLSGALFWRITLPHRTLILRRWPSEHPSPDRLRFIHAVLSHASQRGLTSIPVPLLTRDGQSLIERSGHLWELAPWMPGAADFEREPKMAKLQAAMRELARFHLAVADFPPTREDAPAPAIRGRIQRLSVPHPDGAMGLSRSIDDSIWPELAPLAREFVSALPRASVRAMGLLQPVWRSNLPLQPCIRDIWHDHILFAADEVTGIVDFGALDIDTPAGDVARLLGSLDGDDRERWKRGIDAYESVRPLSPAERAALPGLDASGIVIALANWVRWIYVERRHFENRDQVATRFAKLLNRMRNL